MSRPRYPSDEARLRTRPHVRVHLTVATHQKTAEVWSDLELRAMLVELWRLAREAHANKTGDRVCLTPAAVRSITGRERHHIGIVALQRLCDAMGYDLAPAGTEVSPTRHGVGTGSARGAHGVGTGGSPPIHRARAVLVTVRNFAKKQGLDSVDRGAAPRDSAPSEKERRREERRDEKKRSPTPSARTRDPSPEAHDLARLLHDRIRERSPTAKLPETLDAWATTLDRMIRLDPVDRDPLGIRSMIDWATGHDFWSANVLSAEALRRHWDKMQAQRKRDGPSRGNGTQQRMERRAHEDNEAVAGAVAILGDRRRQAELKRDEQER